MDQEGGRGSSILTLNLPKQLCDLRHVLFVPQQSVGGGHRDYQIHTCILSFVLIFEILGQSGGKRESQQFCFF